MKFESTPEDVFPRKTTKVAKTPKEMAMTAKLKPEFLSDSLFASWPPLPLCVKLLRSPPYAMNFGTLLR